MVKTRCLLLLIACAILIACAQSVSAQQTVTLYAPADKAQPKKRDDSRAWFSFEYGVRGTEGRQIIGNLWGDLGYGFMAIGDEDWFILGPGRTDRSVIKDLGAHTWADSFDVPALTPQPELAPGQQRTFTVDSSGDTHKRWAETTTIFAKIVVGHMYLVHVKRDSTDLYAMFRVEQHEQQNNCTISWKVIPAPEQ